MNMSADKSPWLCAGETLICFGDSITAAPEGYTALLRRRLGEMDIKVINAGRPGDKTPWALTRFQSDVIDAKPDAVSVFLGTNDAAIGHGSSSGEPMVSPEAYRTNLIWMAHLCRLNGINRISIATPAWRFEGKAYEEYGEAMQPYCLAARNAAATMRCPLVPLDTAFANTWNRSPGHVGMLLTHDGIHMNRQGNELIAATMLRTWRLDNAAE